MCAEIAHKHTHTHTHTFSIHWHYLPSTMLISKASISRCKLFSLQGNWKQIGEFFLCLSPSDEFMHLKRSFVTRELATPACTSSALVEGLYMIWGWEGGKPTAHTEGGRKKKTVANIRAWETMKKTTTVYAFFSADWGKVIMSSCQQPFSLVHSPSVHLVYEIHTFSRDTWRKPATVVSARFIT